jgi:6-phospho-beta-glucosidase
MKLAILGGGGFRVPYVYRALLADQGAPRVDDVWLHDTDPVRLKAMAGVLKSLAEGVVDAPRVTPSSSLEESLAGSDFVFAAVRVGGTEARTCDERVALDLDVLGQETTGPGGIAFGLRTIPVMLEVARRVRELAPNAYVINFTNPAGMITEAMQAVLGERVLGICDTPSGLGRRVAGALGVDHHRIQLDYVGLNHLGWMRRVLHDGVDLLPKLLSDEAALHGFEEAVVFGADWLRTLGVIPNEYLYYYYFNRDAVRSIVDSGQTRGEFLVRQQREFYDRVQSAGDPARLWHETVAARDASYMAEAKRGQSNESEPRPGPADEGYAGVAMGVLAAISRNQRATMILNVRNGSTLPALPPDAVIEVPTLVDANGVHPLATAPPELHQAGLMQQVKAVERYAIEAASTGSRDAALKAFALHPLVDSVSVARKLLEGYLARIPEIAAVLSS